MKQKLVCVNWTDIAGAGKWMGLKEAVRWGNEKYKSIYKTYGFILYDSPEYIIVASTHDSEEEREWHDITMIPKAVVKSIKTIVEI